MKPYGKSRPRSRPRATSARRTSRAALVGDRSRISKSSYRTRIATWDITMILSRLARSSRNTRRSFRRPIRSAVGLCAWTRVAEKPAPERRKGERRGRSSACTNYSACRREGMLSVPRITSGGRPPTPLHRQESRMRSTLWNHHACRLQPPVISRLVVAQWPRTRYTNAHPGALAPAADEGNLRGRRP